ncbi:hypothetical protein Tsubulata_045990 [Turnera subulata]|uniref:F-box domain-containing protein n=1 Tax=Turnera subulata TaxID=218843 RepID=A0A9Q0F6D9_9ROSI|nr:hypothetical protein Tsubulata_045990 [Turnera subulata]
MENCFPSNFVDKILARLPKKSIMRFRCVSKEWSSYLVSDGFNKLRCTLRPPQRLLKLKYSGFSYINCENSFVPFVNDRSFFASFVNVDEDSDGEDFCDFFDGEDFFVPSVSVEQNIRFKKPKFLVPSVSVEQSFPFKTPNRIVVNHIGSCDGLVCLHLDSLELVLWNPCTGIHRELPKLDVDDYTGGTAWLDVDDYTGVTAFGFGHAPASCDYKIFIRLILHSQEEVTQIFSLKANSWKKLENHGKKMLGNGLLLHGALHWDDNWDDLSVDDVGVVCNPNIIAFDVEGEEAYDVPSPPPDLLGDIQFARVGIIGDCLCMYGGWYGTTAPHYTTLDIWIMKEYCVQASWVPLIKVTFDDIGSHGYCYDASDMVFRELINNNGHMLMQDGRARVLLIDTQSKTRSTPHYMGYMSATIPYTDGLASPYYPSSGND